MNSSLPIGDYDFDFPEELVAARPAEPRDSSRLMVVRRQTGAREHRVFSQLPSLLDPGDCLVLNETRVLPCRLVGRKATGGKVEVLLVREESPGVWSALGSGLKPGAKVLFPEGLSAAVEGPGRDGQSTLRFAIRELPEYLRRQGLAPLPPYILKRRSREGLDGAGDIERYQTVYAREPGSIAAPTAGLHFTPGVLEALERRGVVLARVTLHVGRGTFRPIEAEDASEHRMLPESYSVRDEQAATIRRAIARGGRVVAVGTTATRVLETLAPRAQGVEASAGETSLYIRPGHSFRAVGGLLTNFHLPRSTPLLLAAAFLGRERLLSAYEEAVRMRYRLYSYGDAMLIF